MKRLIGLISVIIGVIVSLSFGVRQAISVDANDSPLYKSTLNSALAGFNEGNFVIAQAEGEESRTKGVQATPVTPSLPSAEGLGATKKPMVTFCPVETTKCPLQLTKCQMATYCPREETKCPFKDTVCNLRKTNCPLTPTECQGISGNTYCPVVKTKCPIGPTSCAQQSYTKCPPCPTQEPTPTQCKLEQTSCPVVTTECPKKNTECPYSNLCPHGYGATVAPKVPTMCQVYVATTCPPTPSYCPAPKATECALQPTKCPPTLTQCKQESTQCPEVKTKCPPNIATVCPVKNTQCPKRYPDCK